MRLDVVSFKAEGWAACMTLDLRNTQDLPDVSANTDSRVTIAVDLGGTSIRVGVYGASQQLLCSAYMPTRVSAGGQSVMEEIAACLHGLLQELAANGPASQPAFQVLGIGIGSPGPLNLNTGVLGLLPNFPGWDNFALRESLQQAAGLPVFLECDANAAAIAEWKLGAGRSTGLDSMAMITLGTGVGSGIILDGKVWHGMFGMGGEVGHATVDPNGLPCPCGTRGCLELYASANGLIRIANSIAESGPASAALQSLVDTPGGFTPLQVAQLAQQGDASAKLAFARLGGYLGIGLANLINTLDLPMIVIGGGVASAWELFAPAMFDSVLAFSTVYRLNRPSQREHLEKDRTYIRPAVLGSAAGLLGAGLLPWLATTASEVSP